MLKLFGCGIFRDHDYQTRRQPGSIFLECRHCGRRSEGWKLPERRPTRLDGRLRLLIADANAPVDEVATLHAVDEAQWAIDAGSLRLTFSRRHGF